MCAEASAGAILRRRAGGLELGGPPAHATGVKRTPMWARVGILILAGLWLIVELTRGAWLGAGGAALLLALALVDLADRRPPKT